MGALPIDFSGQTKARECLLAWRAALPAGIIADETERQAASENCSGLEREVVALLKPRNEKEVIAIVSVANRFGVPLYSYSIGNNWGYGTRMPAVDGCALVDLSLMNRIVGFDGELGLVTVEPGVTQQQLYDYLASHNQPFCVPTTGAGPRGSLVGNALERGFGLTPDEDHFRAITSVRAVLADGTIYQSPFTEMGAPKAGVWKWGVGPYVDGLFAQGNLGIVTQLQIALVPQSEHLEIFSIALKKKSSLEALLAASKSLLTDLRGPLQGIKLLNEFQMRNSLGHAFETIPDAAANRWIGFGVYRCRKSMVGGMRREIRRNLSPHARILFMNESRLRVLTTLAVLTPGKLGVLLREKCHSAGYVLDVTRGVPRSDALQLVYAHVSPSMSPPRDPVADGVGVLWYAPVLPMKPSLVSKMMAHIQVVLKQYGYPPLLSFTSVTEKCSIGVIPIIYRRPEDAAAAYACYQELVRTGTALGCPPYRVNVASMDTLTGDPDSVYWNSVEKIKRALDPNDILSPGRYCRTNRKSLD